MIRGIDCGSTRLLVLGGCLLRTLACCMGLCVYGSCAHQFCFCRGALLPKKIARYIRGIACVHCIDLLRWLDVNQRTLACYLGMSVGMPSVLLGALALRTALASYVRLGVWVYSFLLCRAGLLLRMLIMSYVGFCVDSTLFRFVAMVLCWGFFSRAIRNVCSDILCSVVVRALPRTLCMCHGSVCVYMYPVWLSRRHCCYTDHSGTVYGGLHSRACWSFDLFAYVHLLRTDCTVSLFCVGALHLRCVSRLFVLRDRVLEF